MLQGLLESLVLMNREFKNIRVEMGKYDKDVETFAENTPIDEFCVATREMMSETVPLPIFTRWLLSTNGPRRLHSKTL